MHITTKIKWEFGADSGEALYNWAWDETRQTLKENLESLDFWMTDGNGGCDCNRGWITGLDQKPEHEHKLDETGFFPCGHRIKFLSIKPMVEPWMEQVCAETKLTGER